MRPRLVLAPVLVAAAVADAACGSSSPKSATAARTVDVDMHDISFSPTTIAVPAG